MSSQLRALYPSYLLNFISMWEVFSYVGVRVLLVLYMSQELGFSDSSAFFIYAIFTTLVEFGGIVGGFLGDRFLGLKKAISLGAWIIIFGHICLYFENLFAALTLLAVGMALFRTNIAALLGTFYSENDPRREAGYTLYYSGMNLGGFLGALICGFVGSRYGWNVGFSLAAIGMLFANIALAFGSKMFVGQRQKKTKIELEAMLGVKKIAIYLVFLILFYACEEQLSSSFQLFSERHIDRQTAFGFLPSSSFVMLNTVTLIVGGPLLYCLLQKILFGNHDKDDFGIYAFRSRLSHFELRGPK